MKNGWEQIIYSYLKLHGNRTSSFITIYPHFKTFECEEGILRYTETDKCWIAATEPLSTEDRRHLVFTKFTQAASKAGKKSLMMPVGKSLAYRLKSDGFNVIQSGSEPIFDLSDYFSAEPLNRLPIAKALKARGAKVKEIKYNDIQNDLKNVLTQMHKQWLDARDNEHLSFLSISKPFEFSNYKRFFIIEVAETAQAFLTAVPIFFCDNVIGYYFADWIRSQHARAASIELLIIETMRILHQEGIKEVRLGNCALANIEGSGMIASLQKIIFNNWKWSYKFKTLYEFKEKLKPTRWDNLYIVSNISAVATICESIKVHKSNHQCLSSWQLLTLLLSRIKWTLFFVTFFVILHVLKVSLNDINLLYHISAYVPGDVTVLGIFWGPLFHNHLKHLVGDQLSLLFFGAIIEWCYGAQVLWLLIVFGLWLSNPLTHILVAPFLSFLSPEAYNIFNLERDYGSSNAVYAIVGGLAAKISRPMLLIIPFAINGVIVCYEKQSILALHHHISLIAGYIFMRYCR